MSSAQERIISRVCPQCGRVLEESWVSCPFCGRDLTGKQEPLRIISDIAAFIEKMLGYAVHWSLYLFALLASYLFSAFNPNTILFGWLIVPVVASFFVGYVITETDTTIKMILVSFLLHAGIMIVLLSVPVVYEAFSSLVYEAFLPSSVPLSTTYPEAGVISALVIYYILNIPVGIGVAIVGIAARDHIGSVLEI